MAHPLDIDHFENRTLGEEVFRARLPSGLGVLYCPKPGFQKKYACYSTYFGSVDNEFASRDGRRLRVPDGIAHFLEHTLFENEDRNVSDLFSLNGAYSNAATSFTTTTYLFAASERFYDNLGLLIDFVETPVFKAEKVEKERGIIEQEIKGYDDSPDWVSYMGLLENLFQKHPIRIDIAGTAETIREVNVSNLEACYNAFYHPENMLLFVTGDLDRNELFDFVAARSRPSVPHEALGGRHYPEEPLEVTRKETRRAMEVALPKLLLGFKEVGVPREGEEYIRRELVSSLALELAFGRSTDVFRELYEEQLVLDDFSAAYGAGAGIGYAMLGGDTPEPDRLKERLLEHAKTLQAGGLTTDDFERGKRKFIGSFVRGFNSLEYIANNYTYFRFHGYDLFETIDLLARVTRRDVEERLGALLDEDRSASYVVEPAR